MAIVKEENFDFKGVPCYVRVEERGIPDTDETVYIWHAKIRDSNAWVHHEDMPHFKTIEAAFEDGKARAIKEADLIAP